MMVNEIKNNAVPWQSTVPQQMPWMSSYDPNFYAMQFGQQPLPGQSLPTVHTTVPSTLPAQLVMPPQSLPQSLLAQQHQQQHHPSPMINFPTATTLTTPPVTTCATLSVGDTLLASRVNMPTSYCGQATTSQPHEVPAPFPNVIPPPPAISQQPNLAMSSAQLFNPQHSLTHIPSPIQDTIMHHKRSSTVLEEDEAQRRPTKQLLSERKLFKKFGTLNLDRNLDSSNTGNSSTSSDSDDSEEEISQPISSSQKDREEFNRYVYLLFKDKKGANPNFTDNNSTIGRLMREERDKMSKAVVLWSPPLKDSFFGGNNDGSDADDEDFHYKDHRDFLKANNDDDSIIITEVTDEEANTISSTNCETDDLMHE